MASESSPAPPQPSDTLVQAAVRVLQSPDPFQKADYTDLAVKLWLSNAITVVSNNVEDEASRTELEIVPDYPAHSDLVRLVPPHAAPSLGRGGSLASRVAILHSLVHIERAAVDLAWDIIARFATSTSRDEQRPPRAFFDDFVNVAADEARHFRLLEARLRELGSFYGALPGHSGLWDSAKETSRDILARLAIEHCVHEARGLDVLPQTIGRFRRGGDDVSADILEKVIYPEEITHCAAGVRWFRYFCRKRRTGRCVPLGMPGDARPLDNGRSPSERPSPTIRGNADPNNLSKECQSLEESLRNNTESIQQETAEAVVYGKGLEGQRHRVMPSDARSDEWEGSRFGCAEAGRHVAALVIEGERGCAKSLMADRGSAAEGDCNCVGNQAGCKCVEVDRESVGEADRKRLADRTGGFRNGASKGCRCDPAGDDAVRSSGGGGTREVGEVARIAGESAVSDVQEEGVGVEGHPSDGCLRDVGRGVGRADDWSSGGGTVGWGGGRGVLGVSEGGEAIANGLLEYDAGDEEYIVREFHRVVRKHFRGRLKPPFNEGARAKAGFSKEWYLPLSTSPPSEQGRES